MKGDDEGYQKNGGSDMELLRDVHGYIMKEDEGYYENDWRIRGDIHRAVQSRKGIRDP
jgi:hypothetical protein